MSRSSLVIGSILLAASQQHERCPASPYSPTFTDFPAIACRYRRTYRYTSLDEFQDTNQAQYSFVRSFTGDEYKNLFVVADDDQVIYQWNGASP